MQINRCGSCKGSILPSVTWKPCFNGLQQEFKKNLVEFVSEYNLLMEGQEKVPSLERDN